MQAGGSRTGVTSVAVSCLFIPPLSPQHGPQEAACSLLMGGEGAGILFWGKERPGHCRGSSWASPPSLVSTYTLAWIWKVCLMGLRGRGEWRKGGEREAGTLSQCGNGDVAERRDVHPRKTVLVTSRPGTYSLHTANVTVLRGSYGFSPYSLVGNRNTEIQGGLLKSLQCQGTKPGMLVYCPSSQCKSS